jgi:hypothetical protein
MALQQHPESTPTHPDNSESAISRHQIAIRKSQFPRQQSPRISHRATTRSSGGYDMNTSHTHSLVPMARAPAKISVRRPSHGFAHDLNMTSLLPFARKDERLGKVAQTSSRSTLKYMYIYHGRNRRSLR